MTRDYDAPALLGELFKLGLLLRMSNAKFDPTAIDHGRAGVKNALIAFNWFVGRVLPDGTELIPPLRELLHALKDLDRGRVPPLLQPAEIDGRPPTGTDTELFRSLAAVLMDLNRQAKMSRAAAAEDVAQKLNRLGYRDEKKGKKERITGAGVKAWRNKMRAAKSKETTEAKQYHSTLAMLHERYPKDPKGAAQLVLESLSGLHRPTITKKPPF